MVRAVPGPRDVPVGANQHGSGSSDRAEHRELPHTCVSSVDPLNPIGPWSNVEGAGLAEIEQYRSGIVKQGEHPPWAALGDEIEIGHAAPEQRVSRAEVVVNVEARHHSGVSLARLVHLQQIGHGLAQGVRPFIAASQRRLRHGAPEHARTDRVPLGLVRIEQALGRCAPHHLGQLPSQVRGVLDADVESLSACRKMHVRCVAGQDHPSLSVGRRLPGHIGEPREPRDVVDTVIRPPGGNERLTKVVQGRLVALPDVRLDRHYPHTLPVFEFGESVEAPVITADAPLWLAGRLGLGNQVAGGRIPPREVDTGFLADQAATAVASDEVRGPQRTTVVERDVDAGVVLGKARHLTSAIARYRQLVDPGGEYPLDAVLEQREPVVVASRKVADVEGDHREAPDLHGLTLREEAFRDSTLIEHLDRARMQTACARAGEILVRAPLDDGYVDPRQRELGRQHHPRRTASSDHH